MSATEYTPLGYCSEEDVENFLMIDISNTFSTNIDSWIASAEKWVNNYLGYTTASGIMAEQFTNTVEDTATVDSEGNLVVFPRKTPVLSLDALSLVKGTDSLDLTLTDGDGNTKYQMPADSDMILYPGYELALSGNSVIKSFFDIRYTKFFAKLTYRAGYTEVPADINLATVNVLSDTIMRHTNKEGLESVSQGGVSKKWFRRQSGESDFVQDAKTLLNPYRVTTKWIRQ